MNRVNRRGRCQIQPMERRLCLAAATFDPPLVFPSGGISPAAMTVGDFNGDGIDDIAVANAGGGGVGVLLGSSDAGAFGLKTSPTAARPAAIAAADFNADGLLDLAVADSTTDSIEILNGAGDGTFISQSSLPIAGTASELAVGDFNSDGLPDLAAAVPNATQIDLLLNTGGGFSLQENAVDLTAPSFPTHLAALDLNGDGYLDVAASLNGTDSLALLYGDGTGYLEEFNVTSTGGTSAGLTAADLNSDGVLDLASANAGSAGILTGVAGTLALTQQYAGVATPAGIDSADLNLDGKADLAIADAAAGVSVLQGIGHGAFATTAPIALSGSQFSAIEIGDFNHDGRPDLAIADAGADQLDVLLNTTTNPIAAAGQDRTAKHRRINGQVASFTDRAIHHVRDLTATIDWGDGHSSIGIISRDPETGEFIVKGRHRYHARGSFSAVITISDRLENRVIVTATMRV